MVSVWTVICQPIWFTDCDRFCSFCVFCSNMDTALDFSLVHAKGILRMLHLLAFVSRPGEDLTHILLKVPVTIPLMAEGDRYRARNLKLKSEERGFESSVYCFRTLLLLLKSQ